MQTIKELEEEARRKFIEYKLIKKEIQTLKILSFCSRHPEIVEELKSLNIIPKFYTRKEVK